MALPALHDPPPDFRIFSSEPLQGRNAVPVELGHITAGVCKAHTERHANRGGKPGGCFGGALHEGKGSNRNPATDHGNGMRDDCPRGELYTARWTTERAKAGHQ